MGDSQIIDWMQEHASVFRLYDVDVFGNKRYVLEWIDDNGTTYESHGISLRDCVIWAKTELRGR